MRNETSQPGNWLCSGSW